MAALDYGLRGPGGLVTGAASGIGRQTAGLLAAMGASVVACDVDAAAGEAAAAELSDGAAAVRFVAADVATDGSVASAVADAVSAFGRLDCAASCAGVGGGDATTHEYPVDVLDRIVAINLRGAWLSTRAEIETMLARGAGGAIVNVSSTLGLRGSPFGSPYSASKHGVLGLTRTAAIEYAIPDRSGAVERRRAVLAHVQARAALEVVEVGLRAHVAHRTVGAGDVVPRLVAAAIERRPDDAALALGVEDVALERGEVPTAVRLGAQRLGPAIVAGEVTQLARIGVEVEELVGIAGAAHVLERSVADHDHRRGHALGEVLGDHRLRP